MLSTLSIAIEIATAMSERRRGRDPSEQQTMDVVLPALEEDADDLSAQLIALQTSAVAAEREETNGVALVRHVNELLLLAGIARRLNGMHQRLMSLFPGVNEELVEAARHLARCCAELNDVQYGRASARSSFIENAVAFLDQSRREIKLLSL